MGENTIFEKIRLILDDWFDSQESDNPTRLMFYETAVLVIRELEIFYKEKQLNDN